MSGEKGIVVHAGTLDYAFALSLMDAIVCIKRRKPWPDIVLLLEHPPVITLGRRATEKEIRCPIRMLKNRGIDVHHVERGGMATYHGPGQLVGYLLFDLKRNHIGPSQLVDLIERAIIAVLTEHGIAAEQSDAHRGVWVDHHKIASIGIGVKGGITFHGFALNCTPNLSHFDLINPCGLGPRSMTSMAQISGKSIALSTIARQLTTCLPNFIGFDLANEPLEKLLSDVYDEHPEAFLGIALEKETAV